MKRMKDEMEATIEEAKKMIEQAGYLELDFSDIVPAEPTSDRERMRGKIKHYGIGTIKSVATQPAPSPDSTTAHPPVE